MNSSNETRICLICDNPLYKERVDELNHSKIIYFYCKTVLKPETKTEEAQYCKGRDHILINRK